MWGLCLVLAVWCSECNSKFCNHLTEEERAGCFTLFVCSCCRVVVYVMRFFLAAPWSLVFSGRTHLSERVVENRKIIFFLSSIGSLLSYSV